ncbi:hypothetical protein J3F84DRAFT_121044 [Trichoderma pleuroticola]
MITMDKDTHGWTSGAQTISPRVHHLRPGRPLVLLPFFSLSNLAWPSEHEGTRLPERMRRTVSTASGGKPRKQKSWRAAMRACRALQGRGSPHGPVRTADSSTRRRHHGEHATLFSMMLGQLAEARFRPCFVPRVTFCREGVVSSCVDSSPCRCSPRLIRTRRCSVHSEIAEACHGHRPFSRAPPSRPLPFYSVFFFSFHFHLNSLDKRFPHPSFQGAKVVSCPPIASVLLP